ncbi:hypothetical protein FY136_28500 (plasmid) [Agrobacterium tumefaciens]|uniref:6-carboxytetrahydropterin synthase n=1 Tax=Agrobacterium tumefaciens TaxID=358 RepID=UPI0021D371A8|nr:6-carboxytetrahydropterin synthase [Agrobacterium tumefaciens]UXT53204.1 hypothetical protein FY136_28500 [Agrobacterium tumefaciens]
MPPRPSHCILDDDEDESWEIAHLDDDDPFDVTPPTAEEIAMAIFDEVSPDPPAITIH